MPGSEPAPYPEEEPTPAGDPGEKRLLRMCSWCNKIEIDGRWVMPEETAAKDRRAVTHGMCEACYQAIEAAFRRQDPLSPP
jgi:hypothetical protein